MSRFTILLVMALALISSVSAASVERLGEDIGYIGTEYTITLQVTDAVPGTRLAVAERLPDNLILVSSHIEGARDAPDTAPVIDGKDAIWAFTAAVQNPTITYIVKLPPTGSDARLDGVYGAAPNDFGRHRTRIALAPLTPGIEGVSPTLQQPAPTGFPMGALILILSGVALAGVCAWAMGEIDMDAVRQGGWLNGLRMLLLASSAHLKMLVADDNDEDSSLLHENIRSVRFE